MRTHLQFPFTGDFFNTSIFNIILSVLTNKPYEAGSLCFYLDVPLCVCILLSV